MKYRVRGMIEFSEDTSPLNSTYLLLKGGVICSLKSAEELIIETDLPVLYKRRASGAWQSLTLSIYVEGGASYMLRSICTDGGKKPRVSKVLLYDTGKEPVARKIRERLTREWLKKNSEKGGWLTNKDDKSPMQCSRWEGSGITHPAIISPWYEGRRAIYSRESKNIYFTNCVCTNDEGLREALNILDLLTDGIITPDGVYHIFDICIKGEGDYVSRLLYLQETMEMLNNNGKHVRRVPVAMVTSYEECQDYLKNMRLMEGVRGAVIRNTYSPYEYGTTSTSVYEIDFKEIEYV